MERSSAAVRTACDKQMDGRLTAGRPKLTWKKLTEKDRSEWKRTTVDLQERSTWRSGVKSAMRAAGQLPRRGPLMWKMPLHLHVNHDMIRPQRYAGFVDILCACLYNKI